METNFTVLVAEDEKLLASSIAKTIERLNPRFRVVQIVNNGEDALDYIQRCPPMLFLPTFVCRL